MDVHKIKRKLRQKMFDYPENKQEQAGRIINQCKQRTAKTDHYRHMTCSAGARYAKVMWM